MIVFFRVSKLIKQLRENSVPESHEALYLFLPMLSAVFVGGSHTGMIYNFWNFDFSIDTLDDIFDLVVFSGGSFLLWKTNRAGNNKHFIDRYICLSFPASIIINIIGFLFGLLAPLILSKFLGFGGGEFGTQYKMLKTVALDLNHLLFFLLMYLWVKKTSRITFLTDSGTLNT